MMGISSSTKVRTLIWSFLVKAGILTVGVGWVILIGLPPEPKHIVPDTAPVLPNPSPQLSAQESVPSGFNALRPQSKTTGLTVDEPLSKTVTTVTSEGLKAKVGILPPLDLNVATQQELERLPGLGTVLAKRILAYRQANGPFHQVEELERVRGIGHKRVEQLRLLVRTTLKKA